MSVTTYKRLEVATNLVVVAVAVLLGIVLVKTFVFDRSRAGNSHPEINEIRPGATISLPDVNWSKTDSHLILVLQKDCRFCSESANFYHRIVDGSQNRRDVELIAALPQEVSVSRKYLSDLGITIENVRQQTPSGLGVRGTPTLLLVDKGGKVTDVWVGKLPPDKESEVLRKLQIGL
jgi:thioredoxin-related protein